ncbi:MAG: phosphoribosyltransferase family protein [Sulfolobales archaeon]
MGGIICVSSFDDLWNISKYIYYGLLTLVNRGQHTYYVSVSNGRTLRSIKGDVTSLMFDKELLNDLSGHAGIGGVYNESEVRSTRHLNLTDNGYELSLLVDGFMNESLADFGKNLIKLVKSGYTLLEAFTEVISKTCGVYALSLITNKSELIVYRSAPGMVPLHVGGYGFDQVIVSSETAPITILGGDPKKPLMPGEFLYVDSDIVKTGRIFNTYGINHHSCMFEYVYMARHDSIIDGVEVYAVRKLLGSILGRRFDKEVDVVVGIPDTAIPYAIGFANQLHKNIELGFVSTGIKFRTAVREDPLERMIGIQLKLNPIKSVFSGLRVALVDDSLVRGLTIKSIIQILRNKLGVKEVHVVIGSPKLVSGCPYGKVVPPKDELLAANLSDEVALKYVEADSLTWLSVEEVLEVFKEFKVSLCSGCFLQGCLVRW